MLELYFKYPRVLRRLRDGELGGEMDRIAGYLSEAGYKLLAATRTRKKAAAGSCLVRNVLGCSQSRGLGIPGGVPGRHDGCRPPSSIVKVGCGRAVASSSVSAMRVPSCSQPSRTLRAACGDALRASWTAAARDRVGERRSGRRDGRLDRTTGWSLGLGGSGVGWSGR